MTIRLQLQMRGLSAEMTLWTSHLLNRQEANYSPSIDGRPAAQESAEWASSQNDDATINISKVHSLPDKCDMPC